MPQIKTIYRENRIARAVVVVNSYAEDTGSVLVVPDLHKPTVNMTVSNGGEALQIQLSIDETRKLIEALSDALVETEADYATQ